MESEEPISFQEAEYPTIKVFENHFEIKDRDYWEFRSFSYDEVKTILLFNPNKSWWKLLFIATSLSGRIFAHLDPWKLSVQKKNGGDWTYLTPPKPNTEFRKVVNLIRSKLK